MTEIATITLPCSVAALEKAILKAAQQGHWHDAEVRIEGESLVIYHRTESK